MCICGIIKFCLSMQLLRYKLLYGNYPTSFLSLEMKQDRLTYLERGISLAIWRLHQSRGFTGSVFKDAHRNRVCMRASIWVSVCAFIWMNVHALYFWIKERVPALIIRSQANDYKSYESF